MMNSNMCRFLGLLLTSAIGLVIVVGNCQAVERTVEFRDGTILRLQLPDEPLPWHKAARDGTVTREPMPWEMVAQLYLVTKPALEKLAETKGLLNQLASNVYRERVEAHKELIEKGVHFRGVVEEVHRTTTDPEVRWRLDNVLQAMDHDVEPAQFNYDLITRSTGEEIEGDVGELELEGEFRGTKIPISRKSICRINLKSPTDNAQIGGMLGRAEEITEDKDELFPKNVTRINFDRGPAGELTIPGRDIRDLYVPLGATIHSEMPNEPDAFISVEEYNVKGRSGDKCAATHDPLYQGTIVVRFCLPGNSGVPAGVHVVGFWTAYIEPEGTALEAYDVHDRLIGLTKTRVRGNDFLAIKSKTPIAYIKVTPDTEIDEDHAIDDLFFDPPVTLAEAGDPKWLTVLLSTGERLKCKSFQRDGEKLTLSELSIGVKEVNVALEEVASIMPATETARRPDVITTDCTVLLDDGSIVRAHGGETLKTVDEKPIPNEKIVALWGFGRSLTLPEDDAWPEEGALLIERDKVYKKLPQWKFGEKWIEAPQLALFDFNYSDSPVIWFKRPPKTIKGAGILRRATGEEYVLHDSANYQLTGWSAETVTLRGDKAELAIPFDEILTLRLPRAEDE